MNRRKQHRVQTRHTPTASPDTPDDSAAAEETRASSQAIEAVNKSIEAENELKIKAGQNRRNVRTFLLAALQAAILIPILFYLEFGEIDSFALSFTGFIVVLCLLVALGFSIPDAPTAQTEEGREARKWKGGLLDYVGAFWLLACAFGPFFGWAVAEGYTLTEANWRWRYVVRVVLAVALPVLTALPLFRYVRGRYWHIALLLLLCVTALPVWSALNTIRDLREGPEVRRTNGFYDPQNASFYPSNDGRPFLFTILPHTQRTIDIRPAPPDGR